jgi:hypothetical protein
MWHRLAAQDLENNKLNVYLEVARFVSKPFAFQKANAHLPVSLVAHWLRDSDFPSYITTDYLLNL